MQEKEIITAQTRFEWRAWLEANHQSSRTEVWLKRYNKSSGIPTFSYDEMVEECLCFGWIDGVVNKFDDQCTIQRITPRRKKSFLSELNRQRIWKLQRLGMMTEAGIAPLVNQIGNPDDAFVIPDWIMVRLQGDAAVWANFERFSHFYKRLKVNWITEAGQLRQEEMEKRLAYLIKMTAQGKRYGAQPMDDI
jgi:uncharacterized protein YdeI (YjbR/CyaY-like superfamily)